MYMPTITVKKSKKASKDKKLNKQSQKQVVNIKIGGGRRRAPQKRAVAVPSQLVMYNASQPFVSPIPSFSNIGISSEPRRNILAEPVEVRRPEGIERPLQVQFREPVRENILGGGELSREDIRQRRILRLSQPEESSMFQDFPPPPLEFLGGGSALEPFSESEQFQTPGRERTTPAREVRRALQISQGAGSDVPLELLIEGIYNLEGQPRRPAPTVNQRVRLIEAGYQVKEPTPKKKKGKK